MNQILPISGYLLAGGRSSRMGRDKALLPLAGRSLAEHGVAKLRRICQDVAILSANPELACFAPLVQDLHPDCGPMSGIEAALAHSSHAWSLIVPVDVPFLPLSLLHGFATMALDLSTRRGTRLALFRVEGVPQPTLLLIHHDLRPYLTLALEQGRYKLFPELKAAAEDLDRNHPSQAPNHTHSEGESSPSVPILQIDWSTESGANLGRDFKGDPASTGLTADHAAARHLYFANLNTPEDFEEAERHPELLDS